MHYYSMYFYDYYYQPYMYYSYMYYGPVYYMYYIYFMGYDYVDPDLIYAYDLPSHCVKDWEEWYLSMYAPWYYYGYYAGGSSGYYYTHYCDYTDPNVEPCCQLNGRDEQ